MSSESPASILFSSDGTELAVVPGVAIPANTHSLITAGTDGTNARTISTDTSGRQVVVGAGTAGTAVGGVVTIQGIASGTPVPISGSITANNASVGTSGSTAPTSSTLLGGSDGTNLQALRATNTTPAGSEYALIVRNVPSGTQPVSGTVTANAGTGNFNVVQTTAANLNAAVVGTGVAGTPAGGVLTIQGVSNGTPVIISGSVTTNKAATSTLTNVAGSATNVQLLASNASRLCASVFNDSTSLLYIKLGVTASATSFTIKLFPQCYWEVPSDYTGEIDGLWVSANGACRLTELTP